MRWAFWKYVIFCGNNCLVNERETLIKIDIRIPGEEKRCVWFYVQCAMRICLGHSWITHAMILFELLLSYNKIEQTVNKIELNFAYENFYILFVILSALFPVRYAKQLKEIVIFHTLLNQTNMFTKSNHSFNLTSFPV